MLNSCSMCQPPKEWTEGVQAMSSLKQSPYILIIATSRNAQIVDFIDEFRQLNWSAVYVGISDAVDYAAVVPCVVLLTSSTWNAPNFMNVVRADPICLIPVLVEPVALPE